jgi:pimeloyl-ACP methyl ester carboxylesterase
VPVFTDAELAAVAIPVQVLLGGSRSSLHAAHPERARTVRPDWRVEVFPDAGHALAVDAEDAVIDRVLSFAGRP